MNSSQVAAKLGENIEQVIEAARRGSLEDLKALVIGAKSLPPSDALAAINALCAALSDVGKIRRFDSAVATSFTCCLGLKIMANQSSVQGSVAEAILGCWQLFSEWMFCALDDFCREKSEKRLRFLRVVELSLDVFSSIVNWSKFTHFALHAWLKIEIPTAKELALLHTVFVRIPSEILSYDVAIEAAKCFSLDTAAVIELSVKRLNRFHRRFRSMADSNSSTSRKVLPRLCGSLSSIHVVLQVFSVHSPSVSAPTLLESFISVISSSTRLLKVLLPLLTRRHWESGAFDILESCLRLVATLLDLLPDICAIQTAQRGGLLTSLALASRHSERIGAEGIRVMKDLLVRILPRNLIYQSFLVSVRKSLREHMLRMGEADVLVVDGPILSAQWNVFLDLLDHYTSALAYFRRKRADEIFACGNKNCSTLGLRSTFKLCGDCKFQLYCSKVCQTASWRAHKVVCKNATCSNLDSNDVWFLSQLAYDEIRRVLPKYKKTPSPIIADIPIEERGFIVKFSGDGDSRALDQFDSKILGNSKLSSSFVPVVNASSTSDSRASAPEGSDYVNTMMVISFPVGSETRKLAFFAAFLRSALDGRGCTCCVYHGGQGDYVCKGTERNKKCPVHSPA